MDNLPLIANLELTNRCNIACKFCAHKSMKRIPMDMDKKMIDLCMQRIDEAGIRQVTLNTIGETLVAPEWEYALKEAKKRGLLVLISTNGMGLDKKKAEAVLKNNCDVFRFSVNSIKKEEYEVLHKGASYDKLLKNMSMLKAMRDKMNSKTDIRVRMVLSGCESEDEKRRLREFWSSYADEAEFVVFGNMGGRNGAEPSTEGTRTGCRTMKRGINITATGDVTYCPCDFDAECLVGSIKDLTLQQIWEGERFASIRDKHDKCDFSSLPQCDFCDATRVDWYQRKSPILSSAEEKIMDSYMKDWRK